MYSTVPCAKDYLSCLGQYSVFSGFYEKVKCAVYSFCVYYQLFNHSLD